MDGILQIVPLLYAHQLTHACVFQNRANTITKTNFSLLLVLYFLVWIISFTVCVFSSEQANYTAKVAASVLLLFVMPGHNIGKIFLQKVYMEG